jgi:hypothetical protein
MSELNYLDYKKEDLEYNPMWWHEAGLSYTASGYGGKIPTSWMLKHNNRLKRVYCMIYSNAGTCYVMSHKDRLILREV